VCARLTGNSLKSKSLMPTPRADGGSSHLNYRPDVDGLRAVAVLLVVFYHLKTAKCTGGFIGVDTFFVISGYLIGSLIIADIDTGRFSLTNFYERRIRRIFPALIVVLLAVAVVGCLTLLPAELVTTAQSLLAAIFSFSNFYFWQHTTYFDATNGTNPLLHTWSLAVEEQFYLILPVALWALSRWSRRMFVPVLCAIAVASLAISQFGAAKGDPAAFYLLHARAWELLLGTLVALCPVGSIPARFRNVASIVGLALIVAPGFVYSDNTPFPGLTALPPCLGTALVILAGVGTSSQTLVARLLSLPPLRFVGLISYSLYLWHWPLIVLARTDMHFGNGISPRILKVSLLALSLALAFLSWRFVETPFRQGRFRPSRPQLFRIAAVSAALVAAIAVGLIYFHGISTRWSGEAVRVAKYLDYNPDGQFRAGSCFIDGSLGQRFDAATCLKQNPAQKTYLLVGDSHAASLWYGLSKTFTDVNINQATATGCKPVLEDRTVSKGFDQVSERRSICQDLMSFVYKDYLPAHPPDTLLIAARWGAEDLAPLHRTLQLTARLGVKVVLFGPMVEYDSPLPRLLAISIQNKDSSIPHRHLLMENWALDAQMARFAGNETGVKYVSLITPVCERYECASFTSEGVPLEFDSNHFTRQGSLVIAQRIKESGGI
jgi:peptidoglycan/LPS O-acetylase OafA/YrhL